jgi:hypothetical protein
MRCKANKYLPFYSLHLTPFCIQHKPSVVACVCIHLACKWSNWEVIDVKNKTIQIHRYNRLFEEYCTEAILKFLY